MENVQNYVQHFVTQFNIDCKIGMRAHWKQQREIRNKVHLKICLLGTKIMPFDAFFYHLVYIITYIGIRNLVTYVSYVHVNIFEPNRGHVLE